MRLRERRIVQCCSLPRCRVECEAMTVESQAEKRAAAQSYDYEKDGRWADYWSNVLIPQHMSARPDVQRHFQLKYYQRYIVFSSPPVSLSQWLV